MSDFVRKPLLAQLNKENPITRIENLESQTTARPSAVIGSISELSVNAGEFVSGTYYVYDPNTGQMRGYLTAYPKPNAPGYHLAFFDTAGVFQFGVNADNGKAIAGAGVVTLDQNGISVLGYDFTEADQNSYKLNDSSGNLMAWFTSGYSTTDLTEITAGIRSGFTTFSKATTNLEAQGVNNSLINLSATTQPSSSDPSFTSGIQISSNSASGYVQLGNLNNTDVKILGTTDTALFFSDASTNRIGISTSTPSYLLDVNGDVNVTTPGVYRKDGVTIKAPLMLGTHGNFATVPASTTHYIAPNTPVALSATTSTALVIKDGVLKNFYIRIGSTQPATGSLVATVMVDNVATALTFTIAAGGALGNYSDTTHTVNITAGQLLNFRIVNNATSASATIGACVIELDVDIV